MKPFARQSAAIFAAVAMLISARRGGQSRLGCKVQVPRTRGPQSSGASAALNTAKWKTYRNEKHRFELRYPETWVVSTGSGSGPDIITFRAPGGGASSASLTVAIQPDRNPKKLSIDEWVAEQLKMLKASPEANGRTTVGGQPAVFMENTNSFGKQLDIFMLLHGSDVLSLSYKHQAEFDGVYGEIIGTLQVLK